MARGKIQDTLKKLCISADLGMSQNPPGIAEGKWPGKGKSGQYCLDCCPHNPALDKEEKINYNDNVYSISIKHKFNLKSLKCGLVQSH